MVYSFIFSMLFWVIGAASLMCVLYVLHNNPKAHASRAFLGVGIALTIWSVGFAIANASPDLEIGILWRRVSALGWGSIFSMLLHFILALTGKTTALKKWWVYLLLYLPAAITVCAFSLPVGINPVPYYLVYTPLGWTNIAEHNGWDVVYYAYYGVFTITCLVLIWLWGKRASDKQVKRQARTLLFSFAAALLLGTLTDVVLAQLSTGLPQMAPIVMLIPVVAVCYTIKHHRFLIAEPVDQNEVILNEPARAKIYHYLFIAFLAGSIVNFAAQHLLYQEGSLGEVLLFSGFLLGIAIFLKAMDQYKASVQAKDKLLSISFTLLIPMITLRFTQYGGITIWAFVFVLMIISLLFNSRMALVSITVSAILTQAFLWTVAPAVLVEVNQADYIVRICILGIAMFLAFYVNKVYVLRLKDNAYRIRFQKLISEISFDFVNINQSNLNEKINAMLGKIGLFFQADRTYVYLFHPERDTMTYAYGWCNEGIEPEEDMLGDIPLDTLPWWMGHIGDVAKLPDEADELKQRLIRRNTMALTSIPIEGEGTVHGFLGIDSAKLIRDWSQEQIKTLRIFANLLADAMVKIKAEKDIEYLAYYDHLTGLPNRTLFTDRVTQAIHLAKRSAKFIGVMFIDIDSFKAINDTMGHSSGDLLIREIAHTLSLHLRKTDTVARFGGDEFMILINNIASGQDVVRVVNSVMSIFEKPFVMKDLEFFITASAGVAVCPVDGEDAETLIKNADIAMYKAKSMGKNQYVLCTADMKDEVQRNMMLSNSLYRVQERNELLLYYQPQICLQTKQIIGLEALLRWKHPQWGMISPSVFIPLAETNGLINGIGEWVLRTACVQNKKWQDMGLPCLRMAVNLSVSQFKNPKLTDIVQGILQETGLNPAYLELEITESVAVKESEYIIDVLNSLKELGVSISIDDFGTEYSSLSRLKMLPIDRIKIDMQFVQGIEGSEKDQAITKIIINLAKSLGLKVIAEGVETAPQLDFLHQRMCDEVQGFYYYRPMPAADIEAMLKNGSFGYADALDTDAPPCKALPNP
ncbi:MAG: EAL domain-containing protein [Bacillota bacterium]